MYHGVLQFMSKLVAGDIIAVRPDREVLQNLNDDDSDYEQVSYSSILIWTLTPTLTINVIGSWRVFEGLSVVVEGCKVTTKDTQILETQLQNGQEYIIIQWLQEIGNTN